MDNYIEIRGVTKRFGNKTILQDVSFAIPKGRIFAVIGENGSGKTTLLNIIVGFHKPTKGTVFFRGIGIFKDKKEVELRFGFATQENSFYDHLDVEENMCYFGKMYNIEKRGLNERIKKTLDLVELSAAKKTLAMHLSVGMKRRLDIACALIHKPEALILDEPTEDLDPVLRKEILFLIRRINEQGTTIIITSYHLEELEDLCNDIAILNNTRIIKTGTPREIEEEFCKK